MQVIALQYAPAWQDAARTRREVEALIEDSPASEGDLVVLPEMSDTGWSLESERVVTEDGPGWAGSMARRFGIHLVTGFARRVPRPPGAANSAVIAHPDGSTGPIYDKVHPFGFTAEPEVYAAGEELVVEPVGPFTAAVFICYDLRFPELHRAAVDRGVDLMITIANWPAPRASHWRTLSLARAIENQAYHVAVNRVGRDPSFEYEGGSLVVSPTGEVLAEGGADATPVVASIDPDVVRDWRSTFPALADRRAKF